MADRFLTITIQIDDVALRSLEDDSGVPIHAIAYSDPAEGAQYLLSWHERAEARIASQTRTKPSARKTLTRLIATPSRTHGYSGSGRRSSGMTRKEKAPAGRIPRWNLNDPEFMRKFDHYSWRQNRIHRKVLRRYLPRRYLRP